jgi:hypothetical protein
MPEWINRMHPQADDKQSTIPLPEVKEESQLSIWPSELRRDEAERSAIGLMPSEGHADWLANLRAAAIMELEAAKEEPGVSESGSEPSPIPRWFAYIRPPLSESHAHDSTEEKLPDASPSADVKPEPPKSAEQPASKPAQKEGLPDLLSSPQPSPVSSKQPASTPIQPVEDSSAKPVVRAESSGQEGMPEWLRELARESPEAELATAMFSSSTNRVEDRITSPPESQSRAEQPLTREEEQGLPDWLVKPVDDETANLTAGTATVDHEADLSVQQPPAGVSN